jgi:glycosyltransferase involved in cell wall biosynthesis
MSPAIPSIAVVIPAFNEAARLSTSLSAVARYLAQYDASELIVVDDGSTDGTARIAEHLLRAPGRVCGRVIRYERNRGKGYAVRTGLLAARAPLAMFIDADLSTPISELPRLVDPIRRGAYDLTFGSRALDRSLIHVRQPWVRETSGRVFNLITRAATGLPFWDTQCGAKAFRMDVFRPVLRAAHIDRFASDVEWLYVARLAGMRLKEIPVRWDHRSGSKVSIGRDSVGMLREVRMIRRRRAAGGYDHAIGEVRAMTHRAGQESPLVAFDPRPAIA